MRLRILLRASRPRGPPAPVVFTLRLSMIVTDGPAPRPIRSQSAMTRAWSIRSNRQLSHRATNLR